MRLNKGGLIASALYVVHFLLFSCLSYSASLKASVLLAEAAVLPAGLILGWVWPALGLQDPPFGTESWMNSYRFYAPVSLVISYLFGWMLHTIWRLLVRYVGPGLEQIDTVLIKRLNRD